MSRAVTGLFVTIALGVPGWAQLSEVSPSPSMQQAIRARTKSTSARGQDELIKQAEAKVKAAPGDLWSHVTLGQLYASSDDLVRAVDLFLKAAVANPKAAEPLIGLGDAYYSATTFDMVKRGRFRQSLGRVILEPDDAAQALLLEAKRVLEQGVKLPVSSRTNERGANVSLFGPNSTRDSLRRVNGDLAEYWELRGIQMERKSDAKSALAAYDEAARLNATYTAHYGRGNALFLLGRIAESVKAFEEALLREPNSYDALNNRMLARLRLSGITDPASGQAKTFLIAEIKSTSRLNRLGAMVLVRDRAILTQAVAANPNLEKEMAVVLEWKQRPK